MKTIFVTGTAGAGKSLLTSKLYEYYIKNGTFAAVLVKLLEEKNFSNYDLLDSLFTEIKQEIQKTR